MTERDPDEHTHEQMRYRLDEPTPAEYQESGDLYVAEAWSPIYPDYPYDTESGRTLSEGWNRLFRLRVPSYYALILRGPDGAQIIRPLTDPPADPLLCDLCRRLIVDGQPYVVRHRTSPALVSPPRTTTANETRDSSVLSLRHATCDQDEQRRQHAAQAPTVYVVTLSDDIDQDRAIIAVSTSRQGARDAAQTHADEYHTDALRYDDDPPANPPRLAWTNTQAAEYADLTAWQTYAIQPYPLIP